MRWFRKNDEAPRLIKLSPLKNDVEFSAAAATTTEVEAAEAAAGRRGMSHGGGSHWSFLSTVDLDEVGDDWTMRRPDSTSHLPCTLKRKPAVRRRAAGGNYYPPFDYIFLKSQPPSLKNYLKV